jgi:hypothetical protein
VQLVALGDVPAATYLDTLFVRPNPSDDVVDIDGSPQKVAAASRAVYSHVDLNELLSRYIAEFHRAPVGPAGSSLHNLAYEVLSHCVRQDALLDAPATLGLIIDAVTNDHPADEQPILRALGAGVRTETLIACRDDDVLGRYSARNYQALTDQSIRDRRNPTSPPFDRTGYLTERLRAHVGIDLSEESEAIALAVVGEWQGTLNELLETARALAGEPALNHTNLVA